MKTGLFFVAGVLALVSGCNGSDVASPNLPASILSYAATTKVVPLPYATDHSPAAEVTVVIANNTSGSVTFNYSRGLCEGLLLRAYSSPDFSGEPVWQQSNAAIDCALIAYPPTQLKPGLSVQIVAYAPVADVLRSAVKPGTYYFQAVVRVGGGSILNSTVPVAAGSVQLSN